MDENTIVEALFQRYLNNKCSHEEVKKLLQYFDINENEELLKSLIHKQSASPEDGVFFSNQSAEDLLNISFKKIKQSITANEKSKSQVIPFGRQLWFRVCAAVTFIILLSATTFYFLHQKDETLIAQKKNHVPVVNDVKAGTNNATLTLDDGTTIVLDSAANGSLAKQGNIKVLKINGQITYKTGDGNIDAKPVYNTIATARGNQYLVLLSDGSKVWLNAASSIHFPAFFATNERRVQITGEAYFEVAKDATKPFRVEFTSQSGAKGEVEVLGTHFDVSAYADDQDIKTTLLEGSVKISRAGEMQMLSPGQQAVVTMDAIALKKDVDVSQVVAWKDGYFVFNNTNIQTIMKQVARWYDVDVNFEGKMQEEGFTGKISRDVPLSEFLKVLVLNDVHVKAEGTNITVSP